MQAVQGWNTGDSSGDSYGSRPPKLLSQGETFSNFHFLSGVSPCKGASSNQCRLDRQAEAIQGKPQKEVLGPESQALCRVA